MVGSVIDTGKICLRLSYIAIPSGSRFAVSNGLQSSFSIENSPKVLYGKGQVEKWSEMKWATVQHLPTDDMGSARTVWCGYLTIPQQH